MDTSNIDERGDVSDERGGGRRLAIGGGVGALLITLIGSFIGLNPDMQRLLQGLVANAPQGGGGDGTPPPADGQKEFSEKVLGSSNAVWQEQFNKQYGKDYKKPHMRLFAGGVQTGCGAADSGVGPFYCPADQQVYLDPAFFEELESRLKGSAADFSKAYVITHEVGHHVQNLLGYNDTRLSREGYYDRDGKENASIRMELQADYLAGVWAYHADKKYHIIQSGDVEKAFTSAKAIGDDTLRKRAGAQVNTESFNHGKSEQRLAFFKAGLETGDASKAALEHFFDKRIKPIDLMPVRR